jgi:ADP-ribose pyrophosphatase
VRPIATEEVFRGNLLRVQVERWAEPDRIREVVHHPGAAAVLAMTPERRVVFVRQLREALRESLLEIPAGVYDEEGESPEETARREVGEETGYRVTSLQSLGRVYTAPGFADERIDLFLAEVEPESDPEEGVEVVEMTWEEAVTLAREGRILDAKTAIAIFLASANWETAGAPAGGI